MAISGTGVQLDYKPFRDCPDEPTAAEARSDATRQSQLGAKPILAWLAAHRSGRIRVAAGLGERLQQQRAFSRTRLGDQYLPVPEHPAQVPFAPAQFSNLPDHVFEFLLRNLEDLLAWRPTLIPHAQDMGQPLSVKPIFIARCARRTRCRASSSYCRYPESVRTARGRTPRRS